MRCARVDHILALALGTLLVCGVINTALAVIDQTWWAWGVGGTCLTIALTVARRWLRPVGHRPVPPPAPGRFPELALFDRDDIDAAA
jgi:hypothetical protein